MNPNTSLRAPIGVPADSPIIEVDGVRLAVARDGRGPAIVCLHAIGHGGRDFDAFTAAVKDRFEVIRIDWPAQGRSGPDSKPLTPTRYAELLAGVLERLHIEEPIIIGNSIGGAAAIIYAGTHRVCALVLCDTGGLVPVNSAARVFCGLFVRFFAAGERNARWFGPAFRAYYRWMVLPSKAAARQRENIIKAGYELAPVLREAWAGFGEPSADIRDIAESLEIPIWFAWARKDKVIPLKVCLPAIGRMKHASLRKFEAGHAAFLEQPDQFTGEFLKFTETLQSLSPERREPALRTDGTNASAPFFGAQ
jgi:pimeloyl-ACP methyl ester carboxylesterase